MPIRVEMCSGRAKRAIAAWLWQTIDIINCCFIEWVREPRAISRRPIAKVSTVDGIPVRRIAVHVEAPITLEQHVVPADHMGVVQSNLLPPIGAKNRIRAVAADIAVVHVVVCSHRTRPRAPRDHDFIASDRNAVFEEYLGRPM